MAFDVGWVRFRLPGREIVWFDAIDSTMHEAARRAAAGATNGTVIGAEEQTAGRGRLGRKWHSEKASGLYFSVVLRLGCPPDSLPVVTLALGLAAQDAILQTAGIACDLRWPNDVLIESKKCAGILVQLHDSAVIAGIGVNINHASFPDEIAAQATSLRAATGREHAREPLLVSLLQSIDSFCGLLVAEGKEPILEMFSRASSYVHGRRVIVDQGDAVLQGVTEGLDPSGFLVLRKDDGTPSIILAGGVRPA